MTSFQDRHVINDVSTDHYDVRLKVDHMISLVWVGNEKQRNELDLGSLSANES